MDSLTKIDALISGLLHHGNILKTSVAFKAGCRIATLKKSA